MEATKIFYMSVVPCCYCDGRFAVRVEDNVAFCPRCETALIVDEVPR